MSNTTNHTQAGCYAVIWRLWVWSGSHHVLLGIVTSWSPVRAGALRGKYRAQHVQQRCVVLNQHDILGGDLLQLSFSPVESEKVSITSFSPDGCVRHRTWVICFPQSIAHPRRNYLEAPWEILPISRRVDICLCRACAFVGNSNDQKFCLCLGFLLWMCSGSDSRQVA